MISKLLMADNKKVWNVIIIVLVVLLIIAVLFLLIPNFTQESERSIVRNLSFDDSEWPIKLIEQNVQVFGLDFPIYCAYMYDEQSATLSLYYSTQNHIPEIREHYEAVLENVVETGTNDVGNVSIEGSANGRKVKVQNYYSDVANLISIEMEYVGEYSQTIRDKLMEEYPAEQIMSSSISQFAQTESKSGYVMYSFDSLASDRYARIPVFSRQFISNKTIDSINMDIEALYERHASEIEIAIYENRVTLKENGFLFTIVSMETDGEVFVVITAQRIP